METKQRSRQRFCARCSVAFLMHDRLAGACGKFVDAGSKEARQLETARKVAEETKVVDVQAIDARLLDRILMAGALEHLQGRIAAARNSLQLGLSLSRAGMDGLAQERFQDALKALGALGAS